MDARHESDASAAWNCRTSALAEALSKADVSLSKTVQTLNESADEQHDKYGNIRGAATLRALAMLLESTCIQIRYALQAKMEEAALDPNTQETAPPE